MITNSQYFIKDNIDSREYGLYICFFDYSKEFFGRKITIEQEEYMGFPTVHGMKDSKIDPVTMMLARLDEHGRVLPWDNDFRNKVSQWLFNGTYSAFQFEYDIESIWYGVMTGGDRQIYENEHGYIEVKIDFATSTAYTKPIIKTYTVNGEKTISFKGFSNINKKIYPYLEIISKGGDVKIDNTNLGISMEIKNTEIGDVIHIDNEAKIITNSNKSFKFSNFNRKWLKLQPRETENIVMSGNFNITFKCQFPIMEALHSEDDITSVFKE